jgi:hypothetical protein
MKAASTTNTAKYNSCFADVQWKATNKLRYSHLSDAVQIDTDFSALLEKELAALTKAQLVDVVNCWAKCTGPTLDPNVCATGKTCDPATKKTYKDATHAAGCKASEIALTVYQETDTAKLNDFRSTGLATQKSYDADIASYGFSKNRPINLDPKSVVRFTNIVWGGNKKVGFAYRDNIAVLGYCALPPTETTCYGCTPAKPANPASPTACAPATGCKKLSGCLTTDKGYCENVK